MHIYPKCFFSESWVKFLLIGYGNISTGKSLSGGIKLLSRKYLNLASDEVLFSQPSLARSRNLFFFIIGTSLVVTYLIHQRIKAVISVPFNVLFSNSFSKISSNVISVIIFRFLALLK